MSAKKTGSTVRNKPRFKLALQWTKGRDKRRAAAAERELSKPLLATYKRQPLSRSRRLLLFSFLALACFAYGLEYALTVPSLMLQLLVPHALLAAVVIWALPAGEYAPTKALAPLFFAFYAALVLWPNYLAISLPGLPWLTLLRLTGAPLTITLLVCISVSRAFRQKLADCVGSDPFIWKALLAFVVLQSLSIPFTDDIGTTINRYVVAQLNWTVIFFVSCIVFLKPGLIETWVKMLLGMNLIVSLLGIWEQRLGFVPWAGHIPPFLKIEDEAVIRILSGGARAATGIHRVQSVATTPLGLAEMLGLTAPFAMHLVLGRYPPYVRLAALIFLPLSVHVILLTDSRLGVVACLMSVMLYLLIWSTLRWRRSRDSIFAPALVLSYPGVLIAFVAATLVVSQLRARVWGNGPQAASDESRREQWVMAIPKILNHPLGHGVGRGADALGFTNGAGVLTIDSYYLTILLETGIIGFIIYFSIFIRASWTAARTVMTAAPSQDMQLLLPLSVSLGNYVVIKAVLSQDANHPLVFMMVGAVVALAHRAATEGAGVVAVPASANTANTRLRNAVR